MRIMHCPQHVGRDIEHNVNSVAKLHPRSVGFTELDYGTRSEIHRLRRILKGYRICTIDRGSHSQEVPIAFRTGLFHKVQSVKVHQLSAKVGTKGIGNDRWMTVVRFKRFGKLYAHVATHWDAGLQNRVTGVVEPTNPRAIAMEGAFMRMRTVVRELKDEGREVFITGDFNYRYHHERADFVLWPYSPQRLFASLGMDFFEDGLDYIAWTRGMELKRPVEVIKQGSGLNLSDHPWLIGTFRRTK